MNCQINGMAEGAEMPEQMPFLRGRGRTAAAVPMYRTAAAAAAPPSLQHKKLRTTCLSPLLRTIQTRAFTLAHSNTSTNQ